HERNARRQPPSRQSLGRSPSSPLQSDAGYADISLVVECCDARPREISVLLSDGCAFRRGPCQARGHRISLQQGTILRNRLWAASCRWSSRGGEACAFPSGWLVPSQRSKLVPEYAGSSKIQ